MKIPSLALIILTKNQSEQVQRTLKTFSADFDAIYILDDNSDDDIKLKLKAFPVHFFQHALENSFAAHRNWILQQVKEDWSFFLDADEELSSNLIAEIRTMIKEEGRVAFSVPRLDIFHNQVIRYGEAGNLRLVRLGQTQLGKGKWQRAVHEVWYFPLQQVGHLETPLLHHSHKNITEFLQKLHRYASLEKAERATKGKWRIVIEMLFFPTAKFVQNYFVKQGWRDGMPGFVYAFLMSYYSLIKRVFWYESLE